MKENRKERRKIVTAHKRCFNCLSSKHAVQNCQSKFSCRTCSKKHHTMLHVSSDSDSKSSEPAPPMSSSPSASEPALAVHSLLASIELQSRAPILLATAVVTVKSSTGSTVTVRALVDQGSEMTFISARVAQLMRAQRIKIPGEISAVGGIHAGTCRHATRITISPHYSNSPSVAATALILKSVTTYASATVTKVTSYHYLSDLQLADPNLSSSDPIDLIIGCL